MTFLVGTFITLPADLMATLTGYTSDIFNDFKPFFLLLIGLFIGFYIVERLLGVFTHQKLTTDETDDDEF